MVVVLGVQAVLLESSPGYHGEAGWAGLDHHGGCVLDPRGQSRCPFLHAQMWDRNKHDYGVVSLCVCACACIYVYAYGYLCCTGTFIHTRNDVSACKVYVRLYVGTHMCHVRYKLECVCVWEGEG